MKGRDTMIYRNQIVFVSLKPVPDAQGPIRLTFGGQPHENHTLALTCRDARNIAHRLLRCCEDAEDEARLVRETP